jgi:predicted amidophosphoribosyltransferase
VHKLKFGGWRTVAPALGNAMAAVGGGLEAEAVTWVPLSARRRRERGYDQAHALAVVVARSRRLPLVRLLERATYTPPQARKGADERREAMRGVFRPARPGRWAAIDLSGPGWARSSGSLPERVLLVDDVLTTGATVGACAEVLQAAGVRDVSALVAARALKRKRPSTSEGGPPIY